MMIEAGGQPAALRGTAAPVFCAALLLATVLPFSVIALTATCRWIVPLETLLAALASTHAFATVYLLEDVQVRRFFCDNPVKMIVVPLALIACGMTILSRPDNPGFVVALLLLFLYQAWHFGAQNIGVASFISLSERSHSLTSGEKLAIKLGTIAGMFGVLKAMAPNYMIGANYVHLGPGAVRLIELSYDLGLAAAVVLTAVALWFAARVWRGGGTGTTRWPRLPFS